MRKFFVEICLLLLPVLTIAQWKSYKIYNGDTINRIDLQGRRQGLWIFFNQDYKNKIVQKGYYKDGKKQGQWIIYYPNGNIKSKITFKDNKPYGPAEIYYPNGQLSEKGFWKINKWIGDYQYYYSNGKPQYLWHYNEEGKREGVQKYFYPNGQLMMEGNWQNGKEQGVMKEYYENGVLKRLSNWQNGQINGKVVEYNRQGKIKRQLYYINGVEDTSKRIVYAKVPHIAEDTTQKPAYRQFTGTGNFKFYNQQGQLVSEGYYKQGVLYTGKKYFYDKSGKIKKIVVYRNGKVIDVINK